MCLNPKLIKNRKYLPNKKNGGNIPPVLDERVLFVPVGCGECIECRKQKSRQWNVRLHEEIKTSLNGKFVTLTFDEESLHNLREELKKKLNTSYIEDDNYICTIAIRRFLERYRKKFKKSIKHWLISEKGHTGTKRIHLHGLLFIDDSSLIEKYWQYGYVYIGDYVNEKTINYIMKYVTKVDEVNKDFKGKIFTSSGLGSNYINTYNSSLNKFNDKDTIETYTTKTGHEINLPIYYRNKLYTEEQREKLWLNKLDKDERWIMGEKIKNFSKNQDKYWKLLKYYQELNNEMGYKIEKDWNKSIYKHNITIINKIK